MPSAYALRGSKTTYGCSKSAQAQVYQKKLKLCQGRRRAELTALNAVLSVRADVAAVLVYFWVEYEKRLDGNTVFVGHPLARVVVSLLVGLVPEAAIDVPDIKALFVRDAVCG